MRMRNKKKYGESKKMKLRRDNKIISDVTKRGGNYDISKIKRMRNIKERLKARKRRLRTVTLKEKRKS